MSGQCPLDRVPFSGCGLLVNKNFVKYEIDSDSRKSFHFDIVVQIIPFSCRQKLLSRKCKEEKKSNAKKDKKKKKEEKNKASKGNYEDLWKIHVNLKGMYQSIHDQG